VTSFRTETSGAAPEEVLRTVFGFPEFRGAQQEIVQHVVDGGDALVLMPTGSGKSLCYQIPAMVRTGTGIVVSPLIALMRDQVTALQQLGVRAECLNSSLSEEDARSVLRRLGAGELDLLYVAPERLLLDSFLNRLDSVPLALFAIDEAHCVSQWGHDFRPEYLELSTLAERFPNVPRIALTATADPPTRREIASKLQLEEARSFVAGFDRPNLRYRIAPKDDPRRQLLRFLKEEHPGESGIVYCLSRKRVEEVAALLVAEGYPAAPYHAGLDAQTRRDHQDRFVADEVPIVVATVAFGMGIDKPDVRFVYHLDPPKSLEAYAQETGRAGRDGLASDAVMTYGLQDVSLLRRLIDDGESDARRRVEHHKLDAMLGFCETTRCRRRVLLEYFGETPPEACGNCDNCLSPVDCYDGTEDAQKVLSAVVRTDQRFGQGYVIDVLLGNDTERMQRFGHHRLPTFGVGSNRDKREWRSIIRQLVAGGLLAVDVDGYGGLRLHGDAEEVLRGARSVELRRDPVPRKGSGRSRGTRTVATQLSSDEDRELFERLRAKRMELAKAQAVPPYVIFSDRTLLEMAQRRPTNEADLRSVHGVGETKLTRYGDAFLQIIREDGAESP
jgi:ATP-dependent DNA helicase RecQ